jgi:hypothetical protein
MYRGRIVYVAKSRDTHQQEIIRYMTGPVVAATGGDLSSEEG